MAVKLRVVRGKLENRKGNKVGLEVEVRRSPFLIGGASDCNMRCPSSAVSDHHCEILVERGVVYVRDLQSDSGTFVNGERIEGRQQLAAGDRLRVGRLEFDVITEGHADSVSDFVSDLLVEADEMDRARRLEDPRARQFQVDPQAQEPAETSEQENQQERPAKKPPGKLPAPPEFVADNTIEAAEETLTKIFEATRKQATDRR